MRQVNTCFIIFDYKNNKQGQLYHFQKSKDDVKNIDLEVQRHMSEKLAELNAAIAMFLQANSGIWNYLLELDDVIGLKLNYYFIF